MENFLERFATLSPDKRALFLLTLQRAGSEFDAALLSFAQERLWFLEQLQPGSAASTPHGA